MNKLIEASINGHLDVVKHLVDNGVDIHIMDNIPLRLASTYDHLDIVKYLIENGADIHACNDSALELASTCGHLNVVHYLKSVYLERYKEKFLCYDCLVLSCCTKLCSGILIKKVKTNE